MIRSDGFKVFIDDEYLVNQIRKRGTKRQAIIAVALKAGAKVASNYAWQHAGDDAELKAEFQGDFVRFCESVAKFLTGEDQS